MPDFSVKTLFKAINTQLFLIYWNRFLISGLWTMKERCSWREASPSSTDCSTSTAFSAPSCLSDKGPVWVRSPAAPTPVGFVLLLGSLSKPAAISEWKMRPNCTVSCRPSSAEKENRHRHEIKNSTRLLSDWKEISGIRKLQQQGGLFFCSTLQTWSQHPHISLLSPVFISQQAAPVSGSHLGFPITRKVKNIWT